MRLSIFLFLALFSVAWSEPVPMTVGVIIVGHQGDTGMAARTQALASRVRDLARQYGLSEGQLLVHIYDYDNPDQRTHCVTDLHVTESELLYIGVVQVAEDGGEKQVLFRIENAEDVEKDAQAAVRTARGLVAPASIGYSPDDPRKTSENIEFYHRLLSHPESLGFHPGVDTVTDTMNYIRTRYVDSISDAQMEAGMVRQVRALLAAIPLPATALDGIPLNSGLAARILALYQDRVPPDMLVWAEVRGVLDPLDDPHSALLTPDQARRLNNTLQETSFAGIGIYIDADHKKGNQIVILDTLEDGPSAHAGLRAGDAIVRIDGLSTSGMTTDMVSSLLRGAVGTTVILTISRAGSTQEVHLTRAVIHPRSMTSKLLPGNIGYLHLQTFATNSATEVEAALLQWKMARVRGFIIDLRNNGGGYVKTAQELCSLFLPRDEVVLSIVGRGGTREDIKSNGPGDYAGYPVVLLVNGYSASASEITAGCLKDHHVATLVGVRTFGKGSMQQPFPAYANQAVLKLTIAHFYSPGGGIIDRLGIVPDVDVPMEASHIRQPDDIQLQKAIEIIGARLTGK